MHVFAPSSRTMTIAHLISEIRQNTRARFQGWVVSLCIVVFRDCRLSREKEIGGFEISHACCQVSNRALLHLCNAHNRQRSHLYFHFSARLIQIIRYDQWHIRLTVEDRASALDVVSSIILHYNQVVVRDLF